MSDKASPEEALPTRTEAEGATVDLPEGLGFFTTGQVLGDRYEILEMLGRGGMGEVWRAFDLKLRVEVGLKALRDDLFQSERRLELLRQEVRAAREVVSPNVCRIFDLIEIDGRELVSMEYVDGATLLGVLQERGPLELKEAQDIASQFLAGLEAIHKAGLVHRDVKPENIMLTRAGRVVVMDFGLARGPESGAGSVSGTPAYMAPEHAAGQQVDARADVYSAGVVLAEMVSPEGIKSYESRQSVWEGVRSEPALVPDSPWAPVIKRAVARDRERRQNSAHTLIRELEDVTLRVEGADDLHPYPGLASFTEDDAEFFFGREAEVERMWRKLEGPPRMLGIMGPSGAGKTSFIRAGLTPNVPPDWQIIRCTPGAAAVSSLAGVVARETAGDPDVAELLPRFDDPDVALQVLAAWTRAKSRSLLIVDQFEELFTQNSAEQQRRFTDLLRRFVLECDIHVLLSMRDDFAASCNAFESLRPIYHELTVLDPPAGANLRRALVQPATKCGYRFENDELVEEILSEVEGERGALPLVAFSLARLWEKRDRDTGLLTREAYHDIGGVGGALARHAEATVDRIGVERIPIVRELFRNLVTAEGTRAVREWDELLSVFGSDTRPKPETPDRQAGMLAATKREHLVAASFQLASPSTDRSAAEDVLRQLIDARLLTSYEVREDELEPVRRVEIIHESLLANWPRLVRWQTQDQEGAQLRDELRQAARAWDEHGRHDDRLWTGTAYREFQLWRERYPGGLTDVENAFANAMKSFATRRKRRQRIAATAVFSILVVVLAVVGLLLQRSIVETQRAEAAALLSRAHALLEPYPSAAIANAIASLELSDNLEVRRLAIEALWKGPTAFVVGDHPSFEISFTPDGEWLAQTTDEPPYAVHVFGSDGSDRILDDIHDGRADLWMGPTSGLFATIPWMDIEPYALWSAPDQKLISTRKPTYSGRVERTFMDFNRKRLILVTDHDNRSFADAIDFSGTNERLGELPFDLDHTLVCRSAPDGKWFAVADESGIHVIEIDAHSISSPRRIGESPPGMVDVSCDPLGRYVAVAADNGEIRLLEPESQGSPFVINNPAEISHLRFSKDGAYLEAVEREEAGYSTEIWSLEAKVPTIVRSLDLGVAGGTGAWVINTIDRQVVSVLNPDTKIRVWPLFAPSDAEPIIMSREDVGIMFRVALHPHGQWLASSGTSGLVFWPMVNRYPTIIKRYAERVHQPVFDPQGRWLASGDARTGIVRVWDLDEGRSSPSRVLYRPDNTAYGLSVSPNGDQLLLGTHGRGAHLVPLDGQPAARLPGTMQWFKGTAFSPSGRFAAAAGLTSEQPERFLEVWDVSSRELIATLNLGEVGFPGYVQFSGDDTILVGNESGLVRWDYRTGEREIFFNEPVLQFSLSSDGNRVLLCGSGEKKSGSYYPLSRAVLLDLTSGSITALANHGDRITALAMDADGTMAVTADIDGAIRVGPITGEEPHLLLGISEEVWGLTIDPKGRWIASASGSELRLWPMPDLSKPPLHTLPRSELIAKLKTLTNLRVVRDPESATGWKLKRDPFPGWETVPEW